jgi:hypothetical protein
MVSLKKLLYSVPEALEIIFVETDKHMEFHDLFPFARDGTLYFSFLEHEEIIKKSLRLHWENKSTKSGASDIPQNRGLLAKQPVSIYRVYLIKTAGH